MVVLLVVLAGWLVVVVVVVVVVVKQQNRLLLRVGAIPSGSRCSSKQLALFTVYTVVVQNRSLSTTVGTEENIYTK